MNLFRIAWNEKAKNFKEVHDKICDKYGLPTGYNVNYITDFVSTDDDMKRLCVAARNGYLKYWKI